MPMIGFMNLTGVNQGSIDGSSDLPEGTIEIYEFKHSVAIPRSGETGLPVGRRIHHDIKICKETDKSTPKLFKALCDGEKLTTVEFSWFRPDGTPGGEKEKYYTVQLENAIITRIKPYSPQRLDLTKEGFKFMEEVSFAYEKIIWIWEPDGIEHEDLWVAPD